GAVLPTWKNERVQEPRELPFAAQPFRLHVPAEPGSGDLPEGRALHRALEWCQAFLDALDGLACLLSCLIDAEPVRVADCRPGLLAARSVGDRDVALGAGWLDADVVPSKRRIGDGVAFGLRLQAGHG